jgi:hypothetical protein
MTDAENFRLLEKLATKLIEDGTDAEEIFDCFRRAYELGKTMGHIEGSDAAAERISARLSRIGNRMEELSRHE